MKNNKVFLLIIFVSCLIVSLLAELFVMNRKVIFRDNKYEPEIIDMEGITKTGNWYKTTTNHAYIIIKANEKDNYIDRIKFNYHTNKDVEWHMKYKQNNKDVIVANKLSSIINKATKKVKVKVQEIKLVIPHKNVRLKDIIIDNRIYINISRIIYMTIVLFGIALLLIKRNYFLKNIEKAFLFIVLICGGLFIFILPKSVYISWDDQIHLKTSYTLFDDNKAKFSDAFKIVESQGKINNSVFQTREEVLELHKSLNKIHNNTEKDIIQINRSKQKYNKIVYLPFYLGFKISDILGLSFVLSIIIAKMFNFLAYVFLIYLAIRISTKLKNLIFVIGLIPTNIFLATQFSYDPTITAGIILGIATFVRMLEMPKINYKYVLLFTLAIVWASLPKAVYCPLLLLIWLIPNTKFISKKEAISIKIAISAIMLLLMSTFVLPVLLGSMGGDVRGGNTNAGAQLSLIMKNPISYAILLIKFICQYGAGLVLGDVSFVHICYLHYYISMFSQIIYMTYLVFTLYVLYTTSFDKDVISLKIKSGFAIMYLGISILIITALYLSFTEVGASTIEGVQHRYFNPMLLMFLLTICQTIKKPNKTEDKNNNILLLLIPFISLVLILVPIIMVGRGI